MKEPEISSNKKGSAPGANPTIASYNPSGVKNYNATNSIARFKNINYFSLM
jgi:hypothetical protein